jgi:hypothetical protein
MRRVRRCGGRLIWHALAALVAAAAWWTPAHAIDGSLAQSDLPQPHFEFWSGAQAYDHVWSLYSGATVAPFGAIQEDGVRLRLVAGYGADSYSGLVKFRATGTFADALIGYHMQLGSLTLKAFAGVMVADPETRIDARNLGGKVAQETWWNLGDQAWTSVDLSWGSLHQSYAARARLGWRLTPALSAGPEAGAAGDLEWDIVRLGGFVRYELSTGEISVSGGATTDKLLDGGGLRGAAQAGTPFVTLSWLTRF